MNEINIGTKVAMVLTDMPLGVSVGKEHFYLYPQTLGRMYLTSQLIDKLEISQDNLKINSFMEALRAVTNHRKESCQLIAYHTLRKKAEMLNTKTLGRRVGTLMKNCNKKNLATLLITILADSTLNDITKDFGIDNESQGWIKSTKPKIPRTNTSLEAKAFGELLLMPHAKDMDGHSTMLFGVFPITISRL